jgi:hypothetical protein
MSYLRLHCSGMLTSVLSATHDSYQLTIIRVEVSFFLNQIKRWEPWLNKTGPAEKGKTRETRFDIAVASELMAVRVPACFCTVAAAA